MYILDHPHFKIYHGDNLTLRANHIEEFNQYLEKIYFFYSKYTEIIMNLTSTLFWQKICYFSGDFDLENIFLELKCSFSNQNTHFPSESDDHEDFLSQKYTIFIPE